MDKKNENLSNYMLNFLVEGFCRIPRIFCKQYKCVNITRILNKLVCEVGVLRHFETTNLTRKLIIIVLEEHFEFRNKQPLVK